MQDYLGLRQRVVLNGQTSSLEVLAGVPQGSLLDPILLLIYINIYLKELGQYADYTSLFSFVKKDKHSQNNLHSDLEK